MAVASGNNAMYLTCTVLKENFPAALEVCEDVLQNPTFPQDEIERMRPNLLAAIRAQDDSWMGELSHFFRTNFFKASPYRLDPIGSAEAVKALTQKDLQEWHAAWCAPNNMVLAVVGDIDPATARAQIEKAFAGFPAKPDLKLPAPPAEPALTKDETFTKYTQKQQAAIYIGFSGMTIKDLKDRYPMDVLLGVVAGIDYPTGWLFNTLRGQGLVYVAAAHNWVGLEPGYFGAYAGCEPAKADEVIKITLQKLDDAKDDKITEEEFERSKRMCITTHELGKQRPASQAGEMALDELYGLGYDFGDKYADAISAVTKDDLKRVAEKFFTKHVICLTTPKK
jgi:zinc protease